MTKKYFRDGSTFKPLAVGLGSCMATDRITVDGMLVGYMYREAPRDDIDSGWSFFSGDETQEYTDDPANWGIYDVNTVANYDLAITPYLDASYGTAFVRNGDKFIAEPLRPLL
jgi:hypothetical protein